MEDANDTNRMMPLRIAKATDAAKGIRSFELVHPDGDDLPPFTPGSHVKVQVPNEAFRKYSLCGDPEDLSKYVITVKRDANGRGGSMSLVDEAKEGDILPTSLPDNAFPLVDKASAYIFIAGGIGITPILSMLRSVVRRGCSFDMVYTARTEEGMAYREDVAALAAQRGRLHITSTHGRLDLVAWLATQPVGATVYVCGPASLTQAVRDAAATLGRDPARVRSEAFAAGPADDDVAFNVELRASGRTLRVAAGASILDTLTTAGLYPLYDCRRGECGLCPLPVVAASGPLRHRDTYLSADERAAGKSLCICVSRVQGDLLVLDA